MSLKKICALVYQTRAGRNTNIESSSNFVLNTSLEIGSAYLYCVKYLLTGIF